MDVLYLIDASNWAHAAHHAAAHRDNVSLASMLESFRRRAGDPENVVAALDHPTARTWRSKLYQGFKEGRAEKDDELRKLLGDLPAIFADADIPTVTAPAGHEADDVMATMATRYEGRVALMSADTDLIQMVSERVFLCRLVKGDRVKLGPRDVMDKYGVSPWQWTDYLALVGKPSNGISGVPGIGAKSAAALLAEFRDLDTILSRPVRMKATLRKKLAGHEELARLCKRLSTLATDLEI